MEREEYFEHIELLYKTYIFNTNSSGKCIKPCWTESLISTKEQIELVEDAIVNINKYYNNYGQLGGERGLCIILKEIIRDKYSKSSKINQIIIPQFLPLFTFNNAIPFMDGYNTTNHLGFWWDWAPYNVKDRVKFLNWILSELRK